MSLSPHTTHTFWKKINRDNLQHDLWDYDTERLDNQYNNSSHGIIVEPIHMVPDYTTIQYMLVSDVFSRIQKDTSLVIISDPSLYTIDSSDKEIIWNMRENILHSTDVFLKKHSIGYKKIFHSFDIQSAQSLFSQTIDLYSNKQLSLRQDVSYYNIYTKTVVPDHRVSHIPIQWTRYYIRFFIDSKKDTIVTAFEDISLLFGCVAILVHPTDKRYKKYIWQDVLIPLTNKHIPIIAYDSMLWWELWTYPLIPAHNRQDFDIALSLWLPYAVYSFNEQGCFTDEAKEFSGKRIDDFTNNIIQFIDDIANLEKKESVQSTIAIDLITQDPLLLLLQKNIYIPLMDRSLQDQSLVRKVSFLHHDEILEEQIEKDERWCISMLDKKQFSFPFLINKEGEIEWLWMNLPLIARLLLDLTLLGLITLPIKIPVFIETLLLTVDSKYIWEHLLEFYRHSYSLWEIDQLQFIFVSLSDSQVQRYDSHIESLFSLFDNCEQLLCTQQWYQFSFDTQYVYQYDHQYSTVSLLIDVIQKSNFEKLTILYKKESISRIKYMLYLYHIVYTTTLPQITYIAIDSTLSSWYDYDSLSSYPWDVVRLFLLSSTTIEGLESSKELYSIDYIYRFLTKLWNASRVLWWDIQYKMFSYDATIQAFFEQHRENLSDYDNWIIMRLKYIRDEYHYHLNKRSLQECISFVIESLRYDITEYSLFITKHYSSSSTGFVSRLAVIVVIHILYPLVPSFSISIAKILNITIDFDILHTFFHNLNLQKNYKCTMMMDTINHRSILLHENNLLSWDFDLLLQTNKDFSDYIMNHKDFVIWCLGVKDTTVLSFFNENDDFPSWSYSKDIFTMKVAILPIVTKKVEEPIIITWLSQLQWQLEYKKQLLQTMKNTIVRLRSLPTSDSESTLMKIQHDIDILMKEIESLEYQISKMKYF